MKKVFRLTAMVFLLIIATLMFTACATSRRTSVEHEHIWGTWVTQEEATCSSMGYKTRTCTDCGDVEYEVISALGHDYAEEGVVVENMPDAGECVMLYPCTVCGTIKMEVVRVASVGLAYSPINDGTEYRVDGIGDCTDTKIIIPDNYAGLPVTEVAEKAFFENSTIISVEIPESIKKIGDKAFSKCELLEKFTMPDEVEIGIDVFRGSIYVEIIYHHALTFVEAKAPTCYEPGNIAYYYCEKCDEFYEDNEGEIQLYDVIIAPSHTFEDGVCIYCGAIQNELMIVSVDDIANLGRFALGTLPNAIGLPTTINVLTADGITHTLDLVWNMSDYDKSTVGVYTITGHIQADDFYFADGLTNQVSTQVEIVEYMEGTADIVFVLDISGSMDEEISTVKNNLISLSQAIDAQGVSARWSIITYSDYVDCPGVPEEITQCVMNGASQWYTNATECKDGINSISMAYGGDDPEVAIDGLMMANTLEKRADARVFYILLTDDEYKVDNNYGVSSMEEATSILQDAGVHVSVIADSFDYPLYSDLVDRTGGIMTSITEDFSQVLYEDLVTKIYEEVVD